MLLGRHAECEVLDNALADVLAGQSRVVVLRGEAGAGKSALLTYLSERVAGWHTASAVGIESEMELAYSGLHQLCVPMLGRLDRLPSPQRDALATVFGKQIGPAPDRFLVGLATLNLFSEVAEQHPLVCLVDDAQWLDAASAQILGFVARRLLAERIALVCAARPSTRDDTLSGLPQLAIEGLSERAARRLLLENVHGPLDATLCDQIIAESHGNPLALLELPRTWHAADLAGGFGFPARQIVTTRIEQSFAKRLLLLPAGTQLFVLAAAAEPLGDPVLLHRAGGILGLDPGVFGPAVDAGLLEVSGRVVFAHPLVRSAAYSSATAADRYRVHAALAQATDPERDPDRLVWHRARATPATDEDVAFDLERSAERAQTRGGIAAAAAFLERATALSPDSRKRAQRALRAAEAKQLAGAFQDASTLLSASMTGPLDELQSAQALRLKGQMALDSRHGAEAVRWLLDAARKLEPLKPELARETYMDALQAATISSDFSDETLRHTAEAASKSPVPEGVASADELLLAALASRFKDGYAASVTLLKQALTALRELDTRSVQDVRWPRFAARMAAGLFDDDAWHDLVARSVQLARDRGALGVLPHALNNLALFRTFAGDLGGAEALFAESDAIADATGASRLTFGRLTLAGFRGEETVVSEQVAAGEGTAIARGESSWLTGAEHARAILYNGMGRYDAALTAAESASAREGHSPLSEWSLPEFVEAAVRCGKHELAAGALARLIERTQATGTEWALGIEARSRAIQSDGPQTEKLHQDAIDRLGRCRIAPEQARAHLLYGEWLRRTGRRGDAREQLRAAFDMLSMIGMDAFAERARRELKATGEITRKRSPETSYHLTPQEAQIARLARDGLANQEIGAQLFLSSRTIEWHLRKVYAKLGIRSRRELRAAIPERAWSVVGEEPLGP